MLGLMVAIVLMQAVCIYTIYKLHATWSLLYPKTEIEN